MFKATRTWTLSIATSFFLACVIAFIALHALRPRLDFDVKTSALHYDNHIVSNSLVALAKTEGVHLYPQTGLSLSLIGKTSNGWAKFTDGAQIAGVLDAAATENGYIVQGRAMLLSLLSCAFIAFVYQMAVGAWSLWIGLIAIPAGAAIYQSCPACSGLEKNMLTFSPLCAVLLVGLLWILLSVSASRKVMRLAIACGCLVWFGQMALIALAPKFCLACLSLGLANCALISLAAARLDNSEILPIRLPRGLSSLAYTGLGAVAMLQGAYAAGWLIPHLAQGIAMPQFIGKGIRPYVPMIDRVKSRILVVTREGCSYCDRAMAALTLRKINFQNVPVNLGDDSIVTFHAKDTPILTPLILVLNPDNTVGFAQSGWPSSSDGQTTLLETLASVRRSK